MEVEPGTVSIIQLAGSRLLDDTALQSGTQRIYRQDNSAVLLTFVSLFGQEPLVGPGWAIEAAPVQLAEHSRPYHLDLSGHPDRLSGLTGLVVVFPPTVFAVTTDRKQQAITKEPRTK